MTSQSILIVEDEAIVSYDLKNLLEDDGYTITDICNSSDKLFSILDNNPYPDLILMDIHIKGSLDGTESSLKIKELYDIPVIFLTAYSDNETLEKAKNSYPYGYITKPYDKRKLLIIIELVLNVIGLEKEIKRREELFSATFKSIADAVIITDDQNKIKYLNPMAKSFITATDVLEQSFDSVFKITIDHEQNRGVFIDKYGKEKTLEVKMTKLDNSLIKTGGFVWILTDITIPVFLESQLRESHKMEAVGRLAGGIAHDFNNLLTVIMGYCSLILDNVELMEQNQNLKSDVTGIQTTSHKAVKLTKQLLTFTSNQVHNPRLVDINDIISDLGKIFDKLIPGNISLNFSLTENQTIINIDPVQLEQVLINLVVNSRDSIEGNGSIQIETTVINTTNEINLLSKIPRGEFILLSVKDNGKGIPENLISKIFEPFFSTKKDGNGVGLGLSTVYGIVQHSGGHIDVLSSLNSGSIFNIYFPRINDEVLLKKRISESKNKDMGKEYILIVEEDEFVRSIMTRILDNKGYNVVEARNAGEAILLSENKETPFELIITDLFMPIISGVELVYRLKNEFPEIISIFTSTHTFESIKDESLLSGIKNFIQKPFDPDDFSLLVRKSLDSN
jgi:two-component system cell cycle sensor histidine kinase/response regulator CckA